ncbi:3-epi-6-deoxocathasterone 23-monooxygenase [Olea europaea subsp. europaea]|uniref:3-epi-6-deoxocathasterone 23-monooxygenase n=1 Tax=Olea europaea subsp. europaea TaxID=158383 RepID=A0A8S0QSS8_OLEEU|nr:3-epi-6-deoxocathasterone 23-monooxygenase [Olea europaea subsp. europaea]
MKTKKKKVWKMYIIMCSLLMTTTLLSAIILYRRIKSAILSSYYSSPLPSGTLGWPFIGETIEFISCALSHRPESFMDKRRRMYGKVFKSHIFGSATLISTDAEVSRIILQSDAKTFVPSYPKSLTDLMGKSSILLISGSLQRRMHGLIGSFFKSPNLKAQITRDMQKYLLESTAKWAEDYPVYIQDKTKIIAFQVLVKALIGLDTDTCLIVLLAPTINGDYRNFSDGKCYHWGNEKSYKRSKNKRFNPWRWQDKEMIICNFTPFGGGQRLYPGLDLARLETSIFPHHFVTQFRWVAEDDSINNFPTVRMKRRMPIWVKRTKDP